MSEEELTRQFLMYLIQQGKNPFDNIPEHFMQECREKYPDLLDLAKKRFGDFK